LHTRLELLQQLSRQAAVGDRQRLVGMDKLVHDLADASHDARLLR
jgi:hypothetical protein